MGDRCQARVRLRWLNLAANPPARGMESEIRIDVVSDLERKTRPRAMENARRTRSASSFRSFLHELHPEYSTEWADCEAPPRPTRQRAVERRRGRGLGSAGAAQHFPADPSGCRGGVAEAVALDSGDGPRGATSAAEEEVPVAEVLPAREHTATRRPGISPPVGRWRLARRAKSPRKPWRPRRSATSTGRRRAGGLLPPRSGWACRPER